MTRRSSGTGDVRDLVLVGALAALSSGVLLLFDGTGPVQWAVAIPFLLLLPGYAFVSAVLPASRSTTVLPEERKVEVGATGWPIRIALALTLSVIIVGSIGVLLNVTVGVTRGPAVLAIGAVTVLFALVAGLRRSASSHSRYDTGQSGDGRTVTDVLGRTSLQSVVIVVALVTLVSAVGFAATAPSDGEPFTEFYVLNETSNGTLVTTDLPESVTQNEGRPLHLGIENHEHRQMTYDVVVQSEAIGPGGNVTDVERVDSFDVRVDSGERAIVERTVVPSVPGEQRRLQFLLYENEAPAEPTEENADVSLHLWVEVAPSTE